MLMVEGVRCHLGGHVQGDARLDKVPLGCVECAPVVRHLLWFSNWNECVRCADKTHSKSASDLLANYIESCDHISFFRSLIARSRATRDWTKSR